MLAFFPVMPYSLNITLRLLTATIGAYGIAILVSLALVPLFTNFLNSELSDAVYAATMWSYVVFFFTFIASFATNSLKQLFFFFFSLVFLVWQFWLSNTG